MMEAAEHRVAPHRPGDAHVPWAFGCLLAKGQMRARCVVVGGVLKEHSAEVALAQRDDVVGAVAAKRANQTL
jgi:hypothetical protein